MNISMLNFAGKIKVNDMDKMMQVIEPEPARNLLYGVITAQGDYGSTFPEKDVVEIQLPETLYGGDVLVKYNDEQTTIPMKSLKQGVSPVLEAVESVIKMVTGK